MTQLLNTDQDKSDFRASIAHLSDEQLVVSAEACLEAVSTLRLKSSIATLHNAPIMFDEIASELTDRLLAEQQAV